MKVQVRHDPPDIGTNAYDWRAVQEFYQPGDRIGWGKTREAAIKDLLEQLDIDPDTKVEVL
ncbi:MAG: hypothetical protein EB116_13850 [Betaproteobacteria bacterium]|nr:hypothetical protein [Betaproteobacteria bacterium]